MGEMKKAACSLIMKTSGSAVCIDYLCDFDFFGFGAHNGQQCVVHGVGVAALGNKAVPQIVQRVYG